MGGMLVLAEWQVALAVFCITLLWYMIFVLGTIKQICKSLDIYCLTIKPKDSKKK